MVPEPCFFPLHLELCCRCPEAPGCFKDCPGPSTVPGTQWVLSKELTEPGSNSVS